MGNQYIAHQISGQSSANQGQVNIIPDAFQFTYNVFKPINVGLDKTELNSVPPSDAQNNEGNMRLNANYHHINQTYPDNLGGNYFQQVQVYRPYQASPQSTLNQAGNRIRYKCPVPIARNFCYSLQNVWPLLNFPNNEGDILSFDVRTIMGTITNQIIVNLQNDRDIPKYALQSPIQLYQLCRTICAAWVENIASLVGLITQYFHQGTDMQALRLLLQGNDPFVSLLFQPAGVNQISFIINDAPLMKKYINSCILYLRNLFSKSIQQL